MSKRRLLHLTAANLALAWGLAIWSFITAPRSALPVQPAVTAGFGNGESAVLGGILYNNNDPLTRESAGVLLDLLQVNPGGTVADVGCCTGYHALAMAERVGAGGHVWAVDVDPDSVRFVESRAQALHVTNLTARVSKPLDAGLPARSMDAILLANVYHCIVNDAENDDPAVQRSKVYPLLASLRRSLAPGGRLLIFDFPRCTEPIRRACKSAQLVEVALPPDAAHAAEITMWTASAAAATRSETR